MIDARATILWESEATDGTFDLPNDDQLSQKFMAYGGKIYILPSICDEVGKCDEQHFEQMTPRSKSPPHSMFL